MNIEPHLNRGRWFRLALVGGLFLLANLARGQIDFGSSRLNGKDLALPVYVTGEAKPVAVLRLRQVGIEYQRRGFFRIGVLPILLGEEVTLELRLPAYARLALTAATNWFRPGEHYRAVEWRDFKMVVAGEKAPRLRAKQVQPMERNALRLSDVVVRPAGNESKEPISLVRAELGLIGSRAGRLYARGDAETALCDLFADPPTAVSRSNSDSR